MTGRMRGGAQRGPGFVRECVGRINALTSADSNGTSQHREEGESLPAPPAATRPPSPLGVCGDGGAAPVNPDDSSGPVRVPTGMLIIVLRLENQEKEAEAKRMGRCLPETHLVRA